MDGGGVGRRRRRRGAIVDEDVGLFEERLGEAGTRQEARLSDIRKRTLSSVRQQIIYGVEAGGGGVTLVRVPFFSETYGTYDMAAVMAHVCESLRASGLELESVRSDQTALIVYT